MHDLDLCLSDISKIEGKASCEVKITDGKVEKVQFQIAEYKRFYTKAIIGKDIMALPQLTARICGTCSNAHLICAIKAVEDAIGLIPSNQTTLLRRLLNFGLIIRDHALHLYVFVLPDMFGKDSILDFDEDNPKEHKILDDAFVVKAAGNNLSKTVGGRSVHAPFAGVGGFTRIPNQEDLDRNLKELKSIRTTVLDIIAIFAQSKDEVVMDILNHSALIDRKLSFLDGEVRTNDGRKIPDSSYGDCLKHVDISYSQASGYLFNGKKYLVGALARLNLGKKYLHPDTIKDTLSCLDIFPSKNIFHNNLAQAIEILHAVDSSIEIIGNLNIKKEQPVAITRKAGKGTGVIEAPRGTLYYRIEVDGSGKVTKGDIVVPTGQNQLTIEDSIRVYLEKNIDMLEDKARVELEIEKIVRAYDPCMSCASHFLKVKWI